MREPIPGVKTILCASTPKGPAGSPTRTLQAVECTDGTFRVLLDGKELTPPKSLARELDTCIDLYLSTRLELLRGELPNA